MLNAIGGFLMTCLFVVAGGLAIAAFLLGADWLSAKLIGFFIPACAWLAVGCAAVLLPLSALKSTRHVAAYGFLIASFFFGLTVWLMGYQATLSLWGVVAVVVGLLFLGLGVVPMGIVAFGANGLWEPAAILTVGLLLTWGTRAFAFWLADLVDRQQRSTFVA